MVKYKIVIMTLAFLALLFASLSLTDWGMREQPPLKYQPPEGLRLPESGIGDVGLRYSPHTPSPLRSWL